jgi:hypothetical protein
MAEEIGGGIMPTMIEVEGFLVIHETEKAVLVEDRRGVGGQLWVPRSLCTLREHPVPSGRYGEGYHVFLREVAFWFAAQHNDFFTREV